MKLYKPKIARTKIRDFESDYLGCVAFWSI